MPLVIAIVPRPCRSAFVVLCALSNAIPNSFGYLASMCCPTCKVCGRRLSSSSCKHLMQLHIVVHRECAL